MNRVIFDFANYDNLLMGYSAKLNVSGIVKFNYTGKNFDTIAQDVKNSVKEYVKANPHYNFKDLNSLKTHLEQNIADIKVDNIITASVTREVVNNIDILENLYEPADQNALDLLHTDGTIYKMGYENLPRVEGRVEIVDFHYPAEELRKIKDIIKNPNEIELSK